MHPNASLCGTATVGAKGQIVIPIEAREKMGIQPGDKVYVICAGSSGCDMIGICSERSMRGFMEQLNQKLSMMESAIGQGDLDNQKG